MHWKSMVLHFSWIFTNLLCWLNPYPAINLRFGASCMVPVLLYLVWLGCSILSMTGKWFLGFGVQNHSHSLRLLGSSKFHLGTVLYKYFKCNMTFLGLGLHFRWCSRRSLCLLCLLRFGVPGWPVSGGLRRSISRHVHIVPFGKLQHLSRHARVAQRTSDWARLICSSGVIS